MMTSINQQPPESIASLASDDELASELLALINDELSLDPDTPVERETDLVATGQLDSLGVMEIVEWLEATLQVSVDSSDIVRENFETVDRMIQFANRLATAS